MKQALVVPSGVAKITYRPETTLLGEQAHLRLHFEAELTIRINAKILRD